MRGTWRGRRPVGLTKASLWVLPFAILALMLGGCGDGDEDATTAGTPPSPSGGSGRGRQQELPTGDGEGGVTLKKVGDFDQPLYVTQPPGDDRDLFVVEKTGRIRVVRAGKLVPAPFLDLSAQVSTGGEQGLLSVAFAPDYRKSGLLYVDYTDTDGDTQVVEYRRSESDPLVADPRSARRVLAVDQPYANHNGGLVLFGPDRLLYVGLGDGGSANDPERRGQDLSTPLGKLLRFDPRSSHGRPYAVPGSNPFVGSSGARPEIYAYGLRNPWRFSFDSSTGALAIGDVGQVEFEEVDLVGKGKARGANFGWSAYEGFTRFNEDQEAPDAVPPALVYTHDVGCSITGGYVVRDPSLPTLYGRYLYGDYCAGQLRSFPAAPGGRADDDRSLGLQVPELSSFGEDNAGHVYATSLEGPVYLLALDGS